MSLFSDIKSLQVGPRVSVEALVRGEEFVGFGEVLIDRVTIRCRELPWRPCVESPEGFSFNRLLLKSIEPLSDGVAIRLLANQPPLCVSNWWSNRGAILELGDEFAANARSRKVVSTACMD